MSNGTHRIKTKEQFLNFQLSHLNINLSKQRVFSEQEYQNLLRLIICGFRLPGGCHVSSESLEWHSYYQLTRMSNNGYPKFITRVLISFLSIFLDSSKTYLPFWLMTQYHPDSILATARAPNQVLSGNGVFKLAVCKVLKLVTLLFSKVWTGYQEDPLFLVRLSWAYQSTDNDLETY